MKYTIEKRNFWGNPDGLIHFCEEKYIYSNYISEFWNSISNISYIIIGCMITWNRIFSNFIILIGIGSFSFHCTGRVYGELIDEIIMDLFVFYIYCSLPTSKLKRKMYLGLMKFFGITIYIIFKNFIIFYSVFFSGILITFIDIYKLARNNFLAFNCMAKFLLYFIPAKIFWISEQTLCHKFPEIYYFHSLWHIFSAISLYYICQTVNIINKK